MMINYKMVVRAYKTTRTKAKAKKKAKKQEKGFDCPACGAPVFMVKGGAYCPAYCDEWYFSN
jgi:transcription elongation factor Elf1